MSRPAVVAALSTALAVAAIVRLTTDGGDDPAPARPAGGVPAALAAAQVRPPAGAVGDPFTAPVLADSIRATRPPRCARGAFRMAIGGVRPDAVTTRDEALAQFKAIPFFARLDAFFQPLVVRTSLARYRVLSREGRVLGTLRLAGGPDWYVRSLRGCR